LEFGKERQKKDEINQDFHFMLLYASLLEETKESKYKL